MRELKRSDRFLGAIDHGLRTLAGLNGGTGRPCPKPIPAAQAQQDDGSLVPTERRHAAALMRVNHAGEIAAQALYQGQALFARSEEERAFLLRAGQEEADHLRWTRMRVESLGGRTSLLDPIWYAGAFALGALASRLGTAASMGFLSETEVQVEAHLKSHLSSLPASDHASRAIVQQMMADEHAHAISAARRGASELPLPVPQLMRASAKLMTSGAYWI
ncbi:MAG: hypothetical protein RL133_1875 [Pseudomonadota bacterium]|jgi:ubiquinone biosynthesis monooxygenase Coq7